MKAVGHRTQSGYYAQFGCWSERRHALTIGCTQPVRRKKLGNCFLGLYVILVNV